MQGEGGGRRAAACAIDEMCPETTEHALQPPLLLLGPSGRAGAVGCLRPARPRTHQCSTSTHDYMSARAPHHRHNSEPPPARRPGRESRPAAPALTYRRAGRAPAGLMSRGDARTVIAGARWRADSTPRGDLLPGPCWPAHSSLRRRTYTGRPVNSSINRRTARAEPNPDPSAYPSASLPGDGRGDPLRPQKPPPASLPPAAAVRRGGAEASPSRRTPHSSYPPFSPPIKLCLTSENPATSTLA